MLNQQPIMVDETTHDLLGPDTYGYMTYRELDVPYIRRWAERFVLPGCHGLGAEDHIRQESPQNTGFLLGNDFQFLLFRGLLCVQGFDL